MSGGPLPSLKRGLSRVFPERRIYVRTDARTRYAEIGPFSQIGILAVTVSMLGWAAFSTSAYVMRATDASRAEMRIETMREAYEARLIALAEEQEYLETQLIAANNRSDAVSDRLAEKQRHLVNVANSYNEAELELSSLRSSHIELISELKTARDAMDRMDAQVAELQFDVAQARDDKVGISTALSQFTSTIDRVITERDAVSNRSDVLDQRVATLESEIDKWETHQERVLDQLESAARTSLSALQKVFDKSDIDLDRILRETKRDFSGKGGLFEPVDGVVGFETNGGARVAALMSDLERVNLMRLAADRMPFGRPVKGARRTSGFGIRRDPFRGRRSMHSGVDWAGPRGTPIYSTGNGVVTFSGRQSGYGIVVKIKHAFGFETLYAHLNRSHVKVGDQVERGDRIADMGSTGRSTGSHLHYEIRVEKQPINPAKFIEAARDVL